MTLNLLDPKLIARAVAVIVIVAVLVWLYVRKLRSTTEELRQKVSGPEYDRAVLKHGSERKAEAKLADREKRVEKLNIGILIRWNANVFRSNGSLYAVSLCRSPLKGAVTDADDLVSSLMKLAAIPYPILINVRPTFLCTIPGWWRTIGL